MFLSLQRTRCLLYTHNTNTSCLLCPSNWNQIISTLPHTQVPPLWNTVAWNSCSYLSRAMQWKTSLLVDSKSWQGKKKQIKSWLRGLKSSRSKPVECGRVWPLTSLNVLQDCCNLTAMKLSIIVCDSSSSCKYPVQGLTLIYSFPQFWYTAFWYLYSEVMIRAVNSTDSVGISAGAISTEKNQTCILYWTFLFHHLLYVFL